MTMSMKQHKHDLESEHEDRDLDRWSLQTGIVITYMLVFCSVGKIYLSTASTQGLQSNDLFIISALVAFLKVQCWYQILNSAVAKRFHCLPRKTSVSRTDLPLTPRLYLNFVTGFNIAIELSIIWISVDAGGFLLRHFIRNFDAGLRSQLSSAVKGEWLQFLLPSVLCLVVTQVPAVIEPLLKTLTFNVERFTERFTRSANDALQFEEKRRDLEEGILTSIDDQSKDNQPEKVGSEEKDGQKNARNHEECVEKSHEDVEGENTIGIVIDELEINPHHQTPGLENLILPDPPTKSQKPKRRPKTHPERKQNKDLAITHQQSSTDLSFQILFDGNSIHSERVLDNAGPNVRKCILGCETSIVINPNDEDKNTYAKAFLKHLHHPPEAFRETHQMKVVLAFFPVVANYKYQILQLMRHNHTIEEALDLMSSPGCPYRSSRKDRCEWEVSSMIKYSENSDLLNDIAIHLAYDHQNINLEDLLGELKELVQHLPFFHESLMQRRVKSWESEIPSCTTPKRIDSIEQASDGVSKSAPATFYTKGHRKTRSHDSTTGLRFFIQSSFPQ